MTIKNGYDQQTADEMQGSAAMADYARLVADQHAKEKGRAEALQFAAYQKAMAEQARGLAGVREAREQAAGQIFSGLGDVVRQTYPVVGMAQARTFTRTEVVTVLKADMAARSSDERPAETALLRYLIRLFERME